MSARAKRKKEKLVVGVVSYGGGLVGWVRDGVESEFEKRFAVRHHIGPVRCIAAVARPEVIGRIRRVGNSAAAQAANNNAARAFMATGGQDETIQLYDLTRLKIIGNLHQHNNEVTALTFFRSKNLLSGDADGIINVWRCYDWQLLEGMTGHKGRVNCISVHPTGAMALSCSADKTVKLWNLLKCRCASTMKFPDEEKLVVNWSPSGTTYAILGRRDIEVSLPCTTAQDVLFRARMLALQYACVLTCCIDADACILPQRAHRYGRRNHQNACVSSSTPAPRTQAGQTHLHTCQTT